MSPAFDATAGDGLGAEPALSKAIQVERLQLIAASIEPSRSGLPIGADQLAGCLCPWAQSAMKCGRGAAGSS
jgi:hypothetical protein